MSRHFTTMNGTTRALRPVTKRNFGLKVQSMFSLTRYVSRTGRMNHSVNRCTMLSACRGHHRPSRRRAVTVATKLVSVFTGGTFPVVVKEGMDLYTISAFHTFLGPLALQTVNEIGEWL